MNKFLIAILFLLVISSFGYCKKANDDTDVPQTLKEITGSVKDENENAYPGTEIKIFSSSNEMTTNTNSNGNFEFDLDNDGPYTVTITPPLSSTVISEDSVDVVVQIGEEKTVNFVVKTQPVEALVVKGLIDIFGEIRNEAGMIPRDPEELLYASNVFDPPIGMLTPIRAPNGDHLTLAEWGTARGNIAANCRGATANVAISLLGMIPNGTYTFWLNFLNKKKLPGEPVSFSADVESIKPLGSGTLNVVRANSSGSIAATINHSSCILTEEVALVLVVVYHINGNTFGSEHIPDEEDVTHMLVYF